MTISVVLFASIREALDCPGLVVDLPDGSKVADLVSHLIDQKGEPWREALTAENIRIAVNQELISEDRPISDGDEVAFFPPVTGG